MRMRPFDDDHHVREDDGPGASSGLDMLRNGAASVVGMHGCMPAGQTILTPRRDLVAGLRPRPSVAQVRAVDALSPMAIAPS